MNLFVSRAAVLAVLSIGCVWAQTPAASPARTEASSTAPRSGGSVSGSVKDTTGGIIPNAAVTLTDQAGKTQTVNTEADGRFHFRGVPAGTYTVSASFQGLQQTGVLLVSVKTGQRSVADIIMSVSEQKQQLTVTESANQVSVDPTANATATTLTGEDL